MTRRMMTTALAGIAVAGFAATLWTVKANAESGDPGEQNVAVSSLPKPAQKQLDKLAGGARIEHVTTENGTFEGAWHKDGLLHEATVSADGNVLEFEDVMPAQEIPAAVKQASKRMFPDGHPNIERQMTVRWVVEGKTRDVTLKPDGRPVQTAASGGESEHEGTGADSGEQREQGEAGEKTEND